MSTKKCDRRIYEFHKLPDGAVAEFWVEGDPNDFACVAVVQCSDTAHGRHTVPHSELYQPPGEQQVAELRVEKPCLYSIAFLITFLTSTDTAAVLNFRFKDDAAQKALRCAVVGDNTTGLDERFIFLKALQS